MIENFIWLVHVLAAAGVIGLVLIQQGKGADVGAAFGSGSAGSLFGSSGSANFLSRSTAILASVFFVTSLALSWLSANHAHGGSVMEKAGTSIPADGTKTPSLDLPPAVGASRAQEIPISSAPTGVPVPAGPTNK
jgi:preprotein translocase subunit SecG